jgi:hypothetical protein
VGKAELWQLTPLSLIIWKYFEDLSLLDLPKARKKSAQSPIQEAQRCEQLETGNKYSSDIGR